MSTPLEAAIQDIREQQANRLKEVARTPEGINATTPFVPIRYGPMNPPPEPKGYHPARSIAEAINNIQGAELKTNPIPKNAHGLPWDPSRLNEYTPANMLRSVVNAPARIAIGALGLPGGIRSTAKGLVLKGVQPIHNPELKYFNNTKEVQSLHEKGEKLFEHGVGQLYPTSEFLAAGSYAGYHHKNPFKGAGAAISHSFRVNPIGAGIEAVSAVAPLLSPGFKVGMGGVSEAAGALYGGAREAAGELGKIGAMVKLAKEARRPEASPGSKALGPIFFRVNAPRALGRAEQHLGTAVRTAAGELTTTLGRIARGAPVLEEGVGGQEERQEPKPKSISTPEEAMLAARRAERATAEEAPKAEAAKGEPKGEPTEPEPTEPEPTEPEPTKTVPTEPVPIKPRTISDIFNNKPTGKPQIVPTIEEPTIAKPKEITNDTTTPEPVIQPVRPVGGNKVLPEVRSTKVSTPEVKSTTVSAKSTGTATPKVGEKIASVQNPHKAGTVESISTTKAGIPQYHIVNPEGEKFVISTKEGVEAKTLPSKEIPKENIEFPKTTTVKAQNIIKSILSGVKTRRTISKSVQGIKGKALLPKGSPALEASKEKEGISKAEKVQGKAENIENLRKSLEHEFQGVVKGSPKKAVEDFEKFMGGTIFDKISSGEALDESEQREFSNAIAALVQFGYIPDSEDTLVNAMEAILRKREREKENATANQS